MRRVTPPADPPYEQNFRLKGIRFRGRPPKNPGIEGLRRLCETPSSWKPHSQKDIGMNVYDLKDHVAIVTGAAQGIGLAVTTRYSVRRKVAIWDRDQDLLGKTVQVRRI